MFIYKLRATLSKLLLFSSMAVKKNICALLYQATNPRKLLQDNKQILKLVNFLSFGVGYNSNKYNNLGAEIIIQSSSK
ncbi:hypothetical protein ACJIZ3_013225 [Penstemon smallii]|uniref:Ribosomal protein L20 n=1 Tax=Penstemon smallii TaxID=265156 RepID=A0ABD3UTA0_9LAMI